MLGAPATMSYRLSSFNRDRRRVDTPGASQLISIRCPHSRDLRKAYRRVPIHISTKSTPGRGSKISSAARWAARFSFADVPDSEWESPCRPLGFDLIWLMGVWERSAESRRWSFVGDAAFSPIFR